MDTERNSSSKDNESEENRNVESRRQDSENDPASISIEDYHEAIIAQLAQYSGPLPPPKYLADYDAIVPGSAKEIVEAMIEQGRHRRKIELSESEHIQSMDKVIIEGDSRRAYWGLIAGFVIAIGVVASGSLLIFNGHDWAGTTMVTTIIVGLVGVFIYGTRSRSAERQQDESNDQPQTKSPRR
jgi:uncharacterized membrane protein